MRAKWVLAALGVVAVIGLAGWNLFAGLERVEERQRTLASEQALRNPLLAAERTLRKLGVDARVVLGHELPVDRLAPDDAVWYYRVRGPLAPAARDRLLAWVERGGHLVMDAVHLRDGRASVRAPDLVSRLDVVLTTRDDRAVGSDPVRLQFDGDEREIEVAFARRWELLDVAETAAAAVWGRHGAHLLQFERGGGRISIAADHDFIDNDRLGDLDHAYYLYSLVGEAGTVWLVHRTELPGLLARLWDAAPLALVLSALLVALLIWRGALRVGPVLAGASGGRRDLVAGLLAHGEFLWRHAAVDDLLAHGRRAAEGVWCRRYPALRRMDEAARCAWIAERSGLTATQVRDALFARRPPRDDFARLTALLQRLVDDPPRSPTPR